MLYKLLQKKLVSSALNPKNLVPALYLPGSDRAGHRIPWELAVLGAAVAGCEKDARGEEEVKGRPIDASASKTAQWRVYTDMGKKLAEEGRMKEAEEYLKSALECAQQGFGLVTPHVAAACNNLAELFRMQGRPTEAKELYEQAIAVLHDSYGSSDLRTAAVYHNLGSVYHQLKDLNKAEDCFKKAIDTRVRLLGKSHTESLFSKLKLAGTKKEQNDLKSVRKHTLECAEVIEERGHGVDTLGQLTDCISLLFSSRGDADALRLLAHAVQIIRNSRAEEQFRLSQGCDRLIKQLQASSQFAWARTIARECRDAYEIAHGKEHILVAGAYRQLAEVELSDPKCVNSIALQWAQRACNTAFLVWEKLPQPSWFGFVGSSPPDHRVVSVAIEHSKASSCYANILMIMDNKEAACRAVKFHLETVGNSATLANALNRLVAGGNKFTHLARVWQEANSKLKATAKLCKE